MILGNTVTLEAEELYQLLELALENGNNGGFWNFIQSHFITTAFFIFLFSCIGNYFEKRRIRMKDTSDVIEKYNKSTRIKIDKFFLNYQSKNGDIKETTESKNDARDILIEIEDLFRRISLNLIDEVIVSRSIGEPIFYFVDKNIESVKNNDVEFPHTYFYYERWTTFMENVIINKEKSIVSKGVGKNEESSND